MKKTGKKIFIPMGIFILIFSISLVLPSCEKIQEPPSDKEKYFNLRFGHNIYPDTALHIAALRFSDIIREKTGGRVKIDVYPAQELGNDHEMVEMARTGELDILLTPTAKMSTLVPAMQYFDLPFLFSSREHAYATIDGEPGRLLLEKLKPYGLVGVSIWENGFKQFTANRPIHLPKDFEGLNIRIMKSQIIEEQFKAFGANPIPIDFHETYKALQDGVVDGEENPLVAITSMKFYEVQPYLIISSHAYLGYIFSFSKKTYDSLPEDILQLLLTTVQDVTDFERQETLARETTFKKTIQEYGVHISTLTEEERKSFKEATIHIARKYQEIIGQDIFEAADKILNEQTR